MRGTSKRSTGIANNTESEPIMPKFRCVQSVSVLVLALSFAIAAPALGQSKSKFVCWKDKSGKVVGCGDTVPPEYRDSAATEVDRRGMTRGTIESEEEAARRRAKEQQTAREKEAERRRLAEQQRLDTALLNTYANEKEIDQRRDRELQQVELAITQLQPALKNATNRYNDARKRNAKDDIARAEAEKAKIEQSVAAREKEKAEIIEKYAAQKKRYTELRTSAQSATATPTSAAPKPKK